MCVRALFLWVFFYYTSISILRSWTESLEFLEASRYEKVPVYRVMDDEGNILHQNQDPQASIQTFILFTKQTEQKQKQNMS